MGMARFVDLDLPPDVFAIVMATGIVAVAAQDHRYGIIAMTLAVIASVMFVVLTVGLGLRIITRRGVIVEQSRNPDVALRMFTFVAAASVLGVVWRDRPLAVWITAALAVAGWLVLIPLSMRDVASRSGRQLRDHAHGAWLLVSVATAGLATTAADLAIITGAEWFVPLGVALWLLAMVLYVAVASLIAWRAIAAPFRPEAVTPDSWILMGAVAITTLAGAHLLEALDGIGPVAWLDAWIGPVTVVLWAVASLWIPVLLYAEIWRVDQQPGSLRFAGVWWSAVFPLGMYASATAGTGKELSMTRLATISLVVFWVAVMVWATVAVGMLRLGWRRRAAQA